MGIRFEIRQQVQTVHRAWLEVIEEPSSERVAIETFRRHCEANPGTYFELVKIEVIEECLGHM